MIDESQILTYLAVRDDELSSLSTTLLETFKED